MICTNWPFEVSLGEEPYAGKLHVRFRGGGTVNRNGKRMVRHGRGNPETELRRNLKRLLIPLPDAASLSLGRVMLLMIIGVI